MTLSICVITMNRASQLLEALTSCLACKLPKATEFVIVNNGSADNTEEEVSKFICDCPYPVHHISLKKNIGVGPGRSLCYEHAKGEYLYFLDDDAYIQAKYYDFFFLQAIKIFEENENIATITTNIEDPYSRRLPLFSKREAKKNINDIWMFFGGSHFIRKSTFEIRTSMYGKEEYGFEELEPSIFAYSINMRNVYTSQISIMHNPRVNKWLSNDFSADSLIKLFHIKRRIYPTYTLPVLLTFLIIRLIKHRVHFSSYLKIISFSRSHKVETRIGFIKLVRMIQDFGYTIL